MATLLITLRLAFSINVIPQGSFPEQI